jgi:NTP pyrophosphatase (non-canonical NTP hydrolase)
MTRLTFEAYEAERLAAQGESFTNLDRAISVGAMGLSGEVGEVVELVKKHLFHGKVLDHDKMVRELGDVLWYVMYTANAVGSSLEEVARINNEKLRARYPNGFSVEAASKVVGDE